MGNNLHLLGTLKNKLIGSDNFSEIMHYFFDHFAENDEFMALGKSQPSKMIESIVTEAASSSLGERAVVTNLRVIRLTPQKFCHGPCMINGRMANLFFFEDIMTGMMGIVMSNKTSEMRYTRITGVPIKSHPAAKWN